MLLWINQHFFSSVPPSICVFNLRPRVRFVYFYFFFIQPVPQLTLHLKSICSASAALFVQDGTEKLILKGKRKNEAKKKTFFRRLLTLLSLFARLLCSCRFSQSNILVRFSKWISGLTRTLKIHFEGEGKLFSFKLFLVPFFRLSYFPIFLQQQLNWKLYQNFSISRERDLFFSGNFQYFFCFFFTGDFF